MSSLKDGKREKAKGGMKGARRDGYEDEAARGAWQACKTAQDYKPASPQACKPVRDWEVESKEGRWG